LETRGVPKYYHYLKSAGSAFGRCKKNYPEGSKAFGKSNRDKNTIKIG